MQILCLKIVHGWVMSKKIISMYIHLNYDNMIKFKGLKSLLGAKEYVEFDMFSKLKFL